MKVLAGTSNSKLCKDIARQLKLKLVNSNIKRFADGEVYIEINENIRGNSIFVVQSTSNPANDNLMELLICIDALRRSSAKTITAVIPYFGYARQDRKVAPRTSISAKVVANLLIDNNTTIATAESCTAGLLSAKLTDVAGSSKYFNGGVVCYSNELKSDLVGVKQQTLDRYGAVSEETAHELAINIAKKLNSDFGVSITGIAGPDGGTEKKPVGLVFVGISYKNNVYIKKYNLTPNRNINRELTVTLCLNEIRKILENSKEI